MYGWIGSNNMVICQTKYLEDLMLIYMLLSITLHKGREFIINTANRCLFRLIELQPSECRFLFLAESSFLLYLLNNFSL